MSAAPNVNADRPAPTPGGRHAQSVAVGIALGVAWLAMRPMLTGFGLALVGAAAAVPAAWTSRRRWRTMSVGSRPLLRRRAASSEWDGTEYPKLDEGHQ